MEFIAKKRTLKITIDENTYQMGVPSIGDQEALDEKLATAPPRDAIKIYMDFYQSKGLPADALRSLDVDEFVAMTNFVFNPKKNSPPIG